MLKRLFNKKEKSKEQLKQQRILNYENLRDKQIKKLLKGKITFQQFNFTVKALDDIITSNNETIKEEGD